MDQNTQENKPENMNPTTPAPSSSQSHITGAIILAAVIIGGAIMLRGSSAPVAVAPVPVPDNNTTAQLAPVTSADRVVGSSTAKVTLIEYADFQCPFCGRFFKDSESVVMDKYVNTGKVQFVYRDFTFLGDESIRAAEAARCAGDQNKFWQYHDYLFNHQNGENQGAFSDTNLKSFATTLGLNTTTFNQCFDSGKYADAVNASTDEGKVAGVNGTPKGFILRDGKIVATIDGAEPAATVTAKIDAALK